MSGTPATFIRVVERPEDGSDGGSVWVLETPQTATPALTFPSRAEAMEAARARAPEWLEVGEILHAGEPAARRHRWTTLRRGAGGEYRPSRLGWARRPH